MRREHYVTNDRQTTVSRARNTLCVLIICVSLFANCQSAGQKNADQPAPVKSANPALILPSACSDAAKPGVLIASAPGGAYWRAEWMQGSEAKGVDGTSVYYSPISYPCAWAHLTDLPGIHFWELGFIDTREGWASVQFLPNLDRGIYRTQDGGKHWTLSTRFSEQDHPREFIETYVWLNAIGASVAGYRSTDSFFHENIPLGYPPAEYRALVIKSYRVLRLEQNKEQIVATFEFEVIGYLTETGCEEGGGTYEEQYTLAYSADRWQIVKATSNEWFTYSRFIAECKGIF